VVELGSHDELMARGGRYRTMFELQASRFGDGADGGGEGDDGDEATYGLDDPAEEVGDELLA